MTVQPVLVVLMATSLHRFAELQVPDSQPDELLLGRLTDALTWDGSPLDELAPWGRRLRMDLDGGALPGLGLGDLVLFGDRAQQQHRWWRYALSGWTLDEHGHDAIPYRVYDKTPTSGMLRFGTAPTITEEEPW